jgi:uncharacterized protein (TIGR00730 family)
MNITVYGGSSTVPGQPVYQEALLLGRLLALAGYTVLTGGYMGTMEATSRGAVEAGGHTIGVTCEEIERWRSSKANPWVKEEWFLPTLHERIVVLMDNAAALIALPGGAGTLTEISLAWNRMLVEAIPARPLILIGPGWKKVFEALFEAQNAFIDLRHRSLLTFVSSAEEAVSTLQRLLA